MCRPVFSHALESYAATRWTGSLRNGASVNGTATVAQLVLGLEVDIEGVN